MSQLYKIFKKSFSAENIKKVYVDSIKNKLSIGIDGKNISVFESKLDDEIEVIVRKVENNSYDFSFYKEKLISKGRNKCPRVISIPTIRDKIVLKIIANQLTEIYKSQLDFELIHTKVEKIKQEIETNKFDSYIKLDIENYYPSIQHDILLRKIRQKIRKTQFLILVKKAIEQATVSKDNKTIKKYSSNIGVPQGLSISNILATIFLLSLDEKYSKSSEYKYYRYVDDILILCDSKDVDSIFKPLSDDFKKIGLNIHELGINIGKSDVGKLSDGFYFIGYKFSDNIITVRDASVRNLHNSIINIFAQYKHSKDKNIELLYWKLNLKITGCKFKDKKYGWMFFFSQINDVTLLFELDRFVYNMFNKFGISYDNRLVKKFSRVYFEILKNRKETSYIPNFSTYSIEQKKEILNNIFRDKRLMTNEDTEKIFDKIIYKNIKEVEKDIQRY